MKKTIILRRPFADSIKSPVTNQVALWVRFLEKMAMSRVEPFAKFLSGLVEEELSPFQALLVLQAVLSFTVLVFSVCVPLFPRLLLLAWFLFALWQCQRAGLR